MDEELVEEIEFRLPNAYAIQFTGGSSEEYTDLIHTAYPGPFVEVDCSTLDSYDDFIDSIEEDLETSSEDYLSEVFHVKEHFNEEGGSLVLYQFDTMDDETIRDMAMYIKGLAEDTPVNIALTVEDKGALFRGNGDLSGRVFDKDLSGRLDSPHSAE